MPSGLPRVSTVGGWLAWFLLNTSGCDSGHPALHKEAAELARALEQVRSLENAQKVDGINLLEAVACSHAEVCRVRDLCLRGYRLEVGALLRTAQVKSKLAALPAGQKAEAALSGALDAASRELESSRPLLEACVREEGALRRAYRL